MPTLQELNNSQIDEAVAIAVERKVPVTLTVHRGKSWLSIPARARAIRGVHMELEIMEVGEGKSMPDLAPADKVGASFKLKHHKHLFTATVVGTQTSACEDGSTIWLLTLCLPTRMHRLQRRAFQRVDVPPNRIVRASFWLGGKDAEPAGGDATMPVWSGSVTNISAGGFQAHASQDATDGLEDGDIVGVRLIFGMGDRAVYADAEVRHHEVCGAKAMIGFRFIGLDQTAEGRAAMQVIAHKVGEYERLAEAASPRRHTASAPFRVPSPQPQQADENE